MESGSPMQAMVTRLGALVRELRANRPGPVQRLEYLHRVMCAMEDLKALQQHQAHSTHSTHRTERRDRTHQSKCFQYLSEIRKKLEDDRVGLHAGASVTILDPEFGLTEDVCFFLVWCMATWLAVGLGKVLDKWVFDVETEALLETGLTDNGLPCPGYLWHGQPVTKLRPAELDAAFACVFQHARHLNWEHHLMARLTVALQYRAAQLLMQYNYPDHQNDYKKDDQTNHQSPWDTRPSNDASGQPSTAQAEEDHMQWCERRVLWSCASARLKLAQLHTLTWRHHVQQELDRPPSLRPTRANHSNQTNQANQANLINQHDLRTYLSVTIKSWIGPRLRESLAKANNRRLLRPDEVGRNAAFDGNNRFCRARGGMDAMENALHNLDVIGLMGCLEEDLVLAARSLRELLVLRIVHNALESQTSCDLMGRHVVLQSLRDSQASNAGTNVNMYVHKIVELPGGFAVTPHQPEYPHTPLLVEDALLLWYNAHFAGADPLGIAGMGNRAGQARDGIEAIEVVEAVEAIESDRQSGGENGGESGGESEENGRQGHGE